MLTSYILKYIILIMSETLPVDEPSVPTETDQEKYERIVARAKTWGIKQRNPYRYDSKDWKWHFMVGFSQTGPNLHVNGDENVPLPRQPSWFARTFRGAQPVPIPENKSEAGYEWTISWGPDPQDKYILYYKIPHERPEGLKGKTPAIESGLYSATGVEPKDWTFPKAEGCKEINVFEVTEKMLDVLEQSNVHQAGVHGRPKS